MEKLQGFSAREAYEELKKGGAIVDIRPPHEVQYRLFAVETVYMMGKDELEGKHSDVPKDLPLIIADSAGMKCREVAEFFQKKGHTVLGYLVGGMVQWDRDGIPLRKNFKFELRGSCVCRLTPNEKAYDEV